MASRFGITTSPAKVLSGGDRAGSAPTHGRRPTDEREASACGAHDHWYPLRDCPVPPASRQSRLLPWPSLDQWTKPLSLRHIGGTGHSHAVIVQHGCSPMIRSGHGMPSRRWLQPTAMNSSTYSNDSPMLRRRTRHLLTSELDRSTIFSSTPRPRCSPSGMSAAADRPASPAQPNMPGDLRRGKIAAPSDTAGHGLPTPPVNPKADLKLRWHDPS